MDVPKSHSISSMSLEDLFEGMNKYKVVRCDMVHERVQISQETGLPAFMNTGVGDEVDFNRNGLCKNREIRLGCAHTQANHTFIGMARKAAEDIKALEPLVNSMDGTIVRIYATDHERGFLEADLARTLHPDFSPDFTEKEIRAKIDDLVTRHRALVAELDDLRIEMLKVIEAELEPA